jgi:hypothetical protein
MGKENWRLSILSTRATLSLKTAAKSPHIQKMLKMKVGLDESLKTKGKKSGPYELLKIKGLPVISLSLLN